MHDMDVTKAKISKVYYTDEAALQNLVIFDLARAVAGGWHVSLVPLTL
jgi:hypothetical protein